MIDLFDPSDPVIRVIDFETDGLAADATVIEVGWTDYAVKTGEIGPTRSYLCRSGPIPADSRAVHHIRPADTADAPPYDRRCVYEAAARDGIYAFAAHNAESDGNHLCGPLRTFCTYKAGLRQWPEAPKHSLFALAYWLEDQGRVQIDPVRSLPSHRAGPDSYVTAVILAALFDEGVTGRDLTAWTSQPALLPRCPIGSYRNQPWSECDTGFLEWILRKVDGEDIRIAASLELERRSWT